MSLIKWNIMQIFYHHSKRNLMVRIMHKEHTFQIPILNF